MWLVAEKQKGTTSEEFWERLRQWHIKVYEKEGNPKVVEWADRCLEVMRETERELDPLSARRDPIFATRVFSSSKGINAPSVMADQSHRKNNGPRQNSIFNKIKEKAKEPQ